MKEIISNPNFYWLLGIGIVVERILLLIIKRLLRRFKKVLKKMSKPFIWFYKKVFGDIKIINMELLALLIGAIVVIGYLIYFKG